MNNKLPKYQYTYTTKPNLPSTNYVYPAHPQHLRHPRPANPQRRASANPQRPRDQRRARDMSPGSARSHFAPADGDARLLGLLHESGALPELLWRDGCCEDTEELVLCLFILSLPFHCRTTLSANLNISGALSLQLARLIRATHA